MTDTSAGLTRLTITEHHYDPMHKQKAFDIYKASEADALLADLRGKLAGVQEAVREEYKDTLDAAIAELSAERAKVRELQERADTAVRSWWVYMAAETDTERDEAYEMMSDAIAALPASVDAKGEDHE
jgi:hypothetical protein